MAVSSSTATIVCFADFGEATSKLGMATLLDYVDHTNSDQDSLPPPIPPAKDELSLRTPKMIETSIDGVAWSDIPVPIMRNAGIA
jgi:hypothetical protein